MHRIATAAAALTIAALASTPAAAKIKCRDGNQLVAGSWISTPYCRDNQVAEVARQYGFKVSDEAIRSNPNYKRRICRFIVDDIRVTESCREVLPSARGRF